MEIKAALSQIKDFRREHGKKHALVDILLLCVIGFICGHTDIEDIVFWAEYEIERLRKFLELVEDAYKQKPLIYTFTNFYNAHLQGKLDEYPLMIAQYNGQEPVLKDERDITMWQYTGKGKINGINGFVDKSRFLKSHGLREIRFRHESK